MAFWGERWELSCIEREARDRCAPRVSGPAPELPFDPGQTEPGPSGSFPAGAGNGSGF